MFVVDPQGVHLAAACFAQECSMPTQTYAPKGSEEVHQVLHSLAVPLGVFCRIEIMVVPNAQEDTEWDI